MSDLMVSLSTLGNFGLYFGISLIFLIAFRFIFPLVTPYKEWELIKSGNVAAAVGMGGSFIGYALAVGSAISNSQNVLDFAVWGVVALVSQVIAYLIIRIIFLPKISERIERDEVSAGVILASIAIAVGLLNAACMTY
ncbi:hypothetical protein C9J21_17560 [Photobacterium phosphoreum]|uniref:DUF350 domain-containing protein n=1 Tax=Photobacterium phosphoreum TaxID=659 RepID=A0A2T3K2Y8_PHOPO|nr:DUF350 domain-containing protein [Photobacterium phosphoreum]PSU25657.1 hypothetical protein CTM96_08065 [Photobacterium phosphoreum]PSU43473.1 hypothetical protein CTM97_03715 [Photobacterium phosphoreum]PSU53794.1 hypothetical protein C9J18_05160 [Photobacterium phosphoreum]PSU70021.1 hypothetical protein C9J22_12555 [Photobacterium phosphoreum]PSU78030.1 hypothetical protein CTM67_12895 [Photobacterium phosphoreum]